MIIALRSVCIKMAVIVLFMFSSAKLVCGMSCRFVICLVHACTSLRHVDLPLDTADLSARSARLAAR